MHAETTYTTVVFEVELLPDEGECYMCVTTHGRSPAQSNPAQYMIRNMDGDRSVTCCGFHLEFLMPLWDQVVLDTKCEA